MPKRVLHRIRLDKIAAVDKPCQQHATVAIMKRAPAAPVGILKQTFQQALGNTLLNDQVREAFYGAFDNMYEGKDAFRTALIDEFTAGGDGTVAADAYKAWLTGLVDRAVNTVRAAGAAQITPDALAKAFTDLATEWLDTQQQEHDMTTITTKAALLAAVAKFDPTKSSFADGDAIVKAAVTLDAVADLPAGSPLAKAAADEVERTSNAKVAKGLQRDVAILKMDTDTRAHFDSLDDAGKDAFLAKSDADRASDIAKARDADPVVHTCSDGTVIRKSDGAAVLAMAKRNDQLAADLAKANEATTGNAIEKRAAEEFPNVAKATAVDMLKSVAAVGAETDAGKSILKTLGTMNGQRNGLFKSLGSTDGGEDSGAPEGIAKARGDFNAKVQEIAKRDSCSQADAMSKARREAPELFAAAHPDSVEAEA